LPDYRHSAGEFFQLDIEWWANGEWRMAKRRNGEWRNGDCRLPIASEWKIPGNQFNI
jgi:hypothetical protein